MATTLNVTDILATGVARPAGQNADNTGMILPFNDGDIIVEVVSTDASSRNVTIVTPGAVGGLAIADQVVAVAAGATVLIGSLSPGIYNAADGTVTLTPAISGATLVFRAYHLP